MGQLRAWVPSRGGPHGRRARTEENVLAHKTCATILPHPAMALWYKSETHAVTGALPLVDGRVLCKVIEAVCEEQKSDVILNYVYELSTAHTINKKQHYKLSGLVTCIFGIFLFCCDAVERFGCYTDIEGRDKLRLETRVAVCHHPTLEPCSNLHAVRDLVADLVTISVMRAAKQPKRRPLKDLMPRGYELSKIEETEFEEDYASVTAVA